MYLILGTIMGDKKAAERWEKLTHVEGVKEYPLPKIIVEREYSSPTEFEVFIEDLNTKNIHKIPVRDDNFGILLSPNPKTRDSIQTVVVSVTGRSSGHGVFFYKDKNNLMVAPSDAYLDGDKIDVPQYVKSGSLLEFGGSIFNPGKNKVKIHYRCEEQKNFLTPQ